MLLSTHVNVRWNYNNKEWYTNLGYQFTKFRDMITVPVEHLHKNSNVVVNIKCDYCGKELTRVYLEYIKGRTVVNKDACNDCREKKITESNLVRYGVTSTLLLDDVKDKIRNKCMDEYGKESYAMTEYVKKKRTEANMERFGHEYPSQVPEIMDKIRRTNIERYGAETALQSKEILETMFENNERKYGVKHLAQLPSVKEKTIATNLHKYGVEHHSQAEDVKEKIAESMFHAGTAVASKQQRYLCDLYSGILTYPIGSYIVDIAFPEKMVAIEYDGGGHWLSLKLGIMSLEEFEQRERKREATIRYQGWKIARIISRNDLLPSEDKLIEIFNIINDYFQTDHSWIMFDIDEGIYRCAAFNKPFDYGDLRRVKSA